MALEGSSGAASGTNFGEQVSGTTLGNSFGKSFLEQLWDTTMYGVSFDDAFREQLLGGSFGQLLWEVDFGSNFGKHLVRHEELRTFDRDCRLPIPIFFFELIPVVPHKAVAEFQK